MTLPVSVQTKLIQNLSDLLDEADEAQVKENAKFPFAWHGDFVRIQQKALLILAQLEGFNNPRLTQIRDNIENLRTVDEGDFDVGWYRDFDELKNLIQVLKESLESDMLGSLPNLIIAAVSEDYLLQARHLIDQGYYVAAAVLVGGVLEDGLRRLCLRQNPTIEITKPNGKPKSLSDYIDDLKKAGLYSEVKAKQLRAWAGIRNDAAHRVTSSVNTEDVELMHTGVENFLAEYL